jgi:nucleotide-binding universal stress UspA family protein
MNMDYQENRYEMSSAIADFHRARNRADLKELLARLRGESNTLFSYDEVRQKLHLQGGMERGVRDIPLDAIVGSVGRYTDFTRDFLPRQRVQPERWARVHHAASGSMGLPPIQVYQIGEIYFVQDGNHRVSVAREMGAKFIMAYVTEVQSNVPLSPDIQPDDLILKAEYSQFLTQTQINQLRPAADLSVSIPGQYQTLLEHIEIHRYFMGIDLQRPILYEEAVAHWYDAVYLPVIEIMRDRGIMRQFLNRTETDLYLWIAEHRTQLENELGFPVRAEVAADHILIENKPNWFIRTSEKLLGKIFPNERESGLDTRKDQEILVSMKEQCLFQEVLVPINGQADGWCALDQAIVVAKRESAILYGLHVQPAAAEVDEDSLQSMQNEFSERCAANQVQGRLVVTTGEVVEQTCLRATATDLVVVNLSHPPSPKPLARISSGFRNLILHCPRLVLATPQMFSPLNHALLAYDGSPKAQEALYVATYLASKWSIQLEILSVVDNNLINQTTQDQVKEYLAAHNVEAKYFLEPGIPAEAILMISQQDNCDLVIMGGYGFTPFLQAVLGSTVDQILRESVVPTLICR